MYRQQEHGSKLTMSLCILSCAIKVRLFVPLYRLTLYDERCAKLTKNNIGCHVWISLSILRNVQFHADSLASPAQYRLLHGCTNQLLFNSLSLHIFRVSCSQTSHCSFSTRSRYRLPMPYLHRASYRAVPLHRMWTFDHLCQQCRDCLLSIGKTECPTCHEPDVLMNAVLEKYLQRVVKSLKVRCSDYKEGCEWVGEQETLKMWRERELNNSWLVQPCRSRYWAGEASESAWNCTLRSIDSEIQTWHPMLFLVSFAHRSSYRVRR